MIAAPEPSLPGALYQRVCYEHGAWPLWRLDKNVAYVAKSLLHRRTPWTLADQAHFTRAHAHLAASLPLGGEPVATLVAGGDLMWIRSGWEAALSPELEALFGEADVSLVNLETPMVPERPVPRLVYETFHYNSPPCYLRPFGRARQSVVSLCNNHALDQGRDGLARTRQVVASQGHRVLGGPSPGDDVATVAAGAITLSCCAFTYGINHLVGRAPDGIGVTRLGDRGCEPDWRLLGDLLARARASGPDLVVVMPHWGYEYEYWPGELQRAHALRLFELGADVIIGSSPHVLQPVELVSIDGVDPSCPLQARRGGPPRWGLVAWSLGNLATVMPTMPCRVGGVLELSLTRDRRGVVQPRDVGVRATVTGRGLGGGLLDVKTVSLSAYEALEARGEAPRLQCRAHARSVLGATVLRG